MLFLKFSVLVDNPKKLLYTVANPARVWTQMLFLKFSVLVDNPEKLPYTVANPARGLKREKRTKEKVWQHTLPHPPNCSFG